MNALDCPEEYDPKYDLRINILKGKKARQRLMKGKEASKWLDAETVMLLQHFKQNKLYGQPTKLPIGADVIDPVWTYYIKPDGRYKARQTGDGSRILHKSKKKLLLYSNTLNHTSFRILTSAAVNKGYNQYSADVTNAYAHAPPPSTKTYLQPDEAIRYFYQKEYGIEIKDDKVLPIVRMLQGHPEASAVWDQFIIEILSKIRFVSATHELSISRAIIDGKEVLLARQVDDFRFAAETKEPVVKVLKLLNDNGVKIDFIAEPRFNGLDIDERREYVRLHATTFINKSKEKLNFSAHLKHPRIMKVPIADDDIKHMEQTYEPITDEEIKALESEFRFKY